MCITFSCTQLWELHLSVMQCSKDTCNITLEMTAPWRQGFLPKIHHFFLPEINVHGKAASQLRGFFYISSRHKAPQREGEVAGAVLYFPSLQNMSKRLSVTGKATFLLKTGARIWVEVFLTFCTVFSAEEKFIWEFLGAFPAVCTKSSHTLVWKAAHSPAQSCHQHPLGTRASKVHEFGAFFPPFTSRKETWNTFLHYIFHWRQGSLTMQETDTKARLISALPSTSVSQRKEKTDFCFPAPDFLSLFCCSHWHCANARIHIHHLKGS